MKTFELGSMTVPDRYQVITRVVAPRPIALVSTLSADGVRNLAPFSFFNAGGANPPSCVICPVNDRHGKPKDTLRNIQSTGEYVINAVTREMAHAMNDSSFAYPPSVDEFEKAGFGAQESQRVAPPRVAQSPVAMECRLIELVPVGDGPLSGNYIIGEILAIHVADDVLTDGMPDNRKMGLLARLGEDLYTAVDAAGLFSLDKPREKK